MNIIEVKPDVFMVDRPGATSNVGYVRTKEGIVLIDTTSGTDEMQSVMATAGFRADEVRLVIISHRNNAQNIFSVELATGELTQLTDFPAHPRVRMQSSFLNPVRDEGYFVRTGQVWAIDLRTLERRKLYDVPKTYTGGNLSCTADGKTVCFVIREDLTKRINMDLGHGYVGFAQGIEHEVCIRGAIQEELEAEFFPESQRRGDIEARVGGDHGPGFAGEHSSQNLVLQIPWRWLLALLLGGVVGRLDERRP